MDLANMIVKTAEDMQKDIDLDQHVIAHINMNNKYEFKIEFRGNVMVKNEICNIITFRDIHYKIPRKERKEYDRILMDILLEVYGKSCYLAMEENYPELEGKHFFKLMKGDNIINEYIFGGDGESILKTTVFKDLYNLKYM